MEDRREWLVARVAEISKRFVVEPPLVVFSDDPAENDAVCLRHGTVMHDSPRPYTPTLLVSNRLQADLTDRDLLYRITYAIADLKLGRTGMFWHILGSLFVLPTVALWFGFYASNRFGNMWLWLTTMIIVGLAGALLTLRPILDLASTRIHLRAIADTDDLAGALHMIRSWTPPIPGATANIERLAGRVEKAARARGYQIRPLGEP